MIILYILLAVCKENGVSGRTDGTLLRKRVRAYGETGRSRRVQELAAIPFEVTLPR